MKRILGLVRTYLKTGGVLLVLCLASGCFLPRRPGPRVDTSQDARILDEVRARLIAEPALQAERLRVDVRGGVVLLYGGVDGIAAWNCAIRNAQLVPGVQSVVDYLVIDRGPPHVECLAPREAPDGAGPHPAAPHPRVGPLD